MKRAIVSAPGRACLFGEHMDWCGYYVIPAAIDMRSFLEVSPSERPDVVEVHSYPPFDTYAEYHVKDLMINRSSDLRYVGGVLKAMLVESHVDYCQGIKLKFARAEEVSRLTCNNDLVNLPTNKGLSSSSAISVAAAFAIDIALMNPEDEICATRAIEDEEKLSRYASLAYIGENNLLGINCGQMDQFASAYGGLLFIDCRFEPAEVERLKPQVEMPLVIGDTGQGKDTTKILAWLCEKFKHKERKFMEGVGEIVKIVLEARDELRKSKPDLYKIGELMNLNQHYLAEYLQVSGDCPVSPNKLEVLIEAALNAGALGAKLSGSGGGGCMIAICLPEDIEAVSEAISRVGGHPYVTKVADKGLRLEYFES